MSNKTGKPNRKYKQMVTLLMLAVYLFFAMADMTMEVMHKISHAWQNSSDAPHTHNHGSRMHSHGEVQHHHQVLAFLNLLIDSTDSENPLEAKVKIVVDKHLIQDGLVHLSYYSEPFLKHFSLFSRLLLSKKAWGNTDPPENLNLLIL